MNLSQNPSCLYCGIKFTTPNLGIFAFTLNVCRNKYCKAHKLLQEVHYNDEQNLKP